MSNFVFNGVSAADMGLVVERFPGQYVPRKRMTSIPIPGRSGDLHQWDGSYENFTKRYSCWFKELPLTPGVAARASAIVDWLMSAPAASRLEDTHAPDVFHLATYQGGADIESIYNRYGRFTVEFDCAAPAYLIDGETPAELNATGTQGDVVWRGIFNPTSHASYPLIEVTGNVSGVIYVGDAQLLVRFIGYDDERTLYVDCYTREAWEVVDGVEVSRNAWVLADYPQLPAGATRIWFEDTGSTGIKRVKIYPRWWRL